MIPQKLYILEKNQTIYCNCKQQFLLKRNTFNLNRTINYFMQVMYHLCSKNTIPLKHQYTQPFPVKLHENAPFLIKARSHNLPWLTISHWGTDVWKDKSQFTLSASNNFVREGPVNDVVSHWRCFESDCSFRLVSNGLKFNIKFLAGLFGGGSMLQSLAISAILQTKVTSIADYVQ